jgi:hypothetical protein
VEFHLHDYIIPHLFQITRNPHFVAALLSRSTPGFSPQGATLSPAPRLQIPLARAPLHATLHLYPGRYRGREGRDAAAQRRGVVRVTLCHVPFRSPSPRKIVIPTSTTYTAGTTRTNKEVP